MNLKRFTIAAIIFVLIYSQCSIYSQVNDSVTLKVKKIYTSKIVWSPTIEDMNKLTQDCAGKSGDNLSECLVNFMIQSGANSEAVNFTRQIGGMGYVQSYKSGELIDVAYVYYPFNQINHNGVYLVNGKPDILNPYDDSNYPLDEIENDKEYKKIKSRFKHLAIFPEGSASTQYPLFKKMGKEGEQYLVKYRLKDGCKDCQLLGYLTLAFNFDTLANFKNTQLVKVTNLVPNEIPTVNNSVLGRIFTSPTQPININKGDDFVITLQAKSTSKYHWKLADGLDTQMIQFVGSDYVAPYYRELPNSTGKYVFRFKAIAKGNVKIKFDYVPSWENSSDPGQKIEFNVNVY